MAVAGLFRRKLIGEQQQVSEVCEVLIVQVARDTTTLALGFVGKLQARSRKLSIGRRQRSARALDSPVLDDGPDECDEREREQYGERGGRLWKRRTGDAELEDERLGCNQVSGESAHLDAIVAGPQVVHQELRIHRELAPDHASRAVA